MNSPIAIYYLLEEGDERNRCWLTQEYFFVQQRGKLRRFDLERVQYLAVEQRRWWFPVVAGGILAPLSLLAILLNLYNPWWLISLLVGSMLLWYWGASKHEVLSVHQPHHRQDIALTMVTPNLRAFVNFVNRFLRQGLLPLYVKAEPEAWQEARQSGSYRPKILKEKGFIPVYTAEKAKTEGRWLFIDPLKVASPIRYENEGDQLVPRIYGSIPLTAISSH